MEDKDELMTLDEAIKYHSGLSEKMILSPNVKDHKCGREHLQLYNWLIELRERRRLDETKGEPIGDVEIEKFLRNHRSSGDVGMMAATHYIEELWKKVKEYGKTGSK